MNHTIRDQETRSATRDRQQETLGQVLAKQPPAAAAQRGANGKFSSPGGAAGDQKTGDIQTRNQKQAARRRKQHVQRSLNLSNDGLQ